MNNKVDLQNRIVKLCFLLAVIANTVFGNNVEGVVDKMVWRKNSKAIWD